MDPHTLDKLEFDRVRQLLATFARCSLGRERALRISPSHVLADVQRWHEQVRQLRELIPARGLPPFGGIHDVRQIVRAVKPPSPLESADYAVIGETLEGLAHLHKYFADLPSTCGELVPVAARLGDYSSIAERIRATIDDRGLVRDDASDKLHRLRIAIANTLEDVRRVFDKLLRQQEVVKYLQYANATFHDDRMVLPLRSDQRGRIPGIVHRSSDTGRTLFIEPSEAVELNNTLIELRGDESKEVGRILWQLGHLIHVNEREILRTLDAAALIDLIVAKIRYAEAYDMSVPVISADRRMRLTRARHPLLLAMRRGALEPVSNQQSAVSGQQSDSTTQVVGRSNATYKSGVDAAAARPAKTADSDNAVVPIDVRLGDDFDMLVVTGPNTGGKTAALKTVGLLVTMAHAGMPIPAAAATIPIFDDVLIDVGDEQSLEQSLSTFSAHMARVMDVLSRATDKTLVLIDEMGAGTDPDEGAALGLAIVDELLRRGCLTIVTTHLGALKAVAYQRERAENACVQFDMESLRPTYVLLIGEPGASNAIRIAQRLGLPWQIVRQAEEQLAGQQRTLAQAIEGTSVVRRKAEEARKVAEEATRKADEETRALRIQTAEMEERTRQFAQWSQRIQSLRPGDKVKLKRFDREGTVVRVKMTHQTAVVSVGAMEYEVPFTDIAV